MEVLLSDRPATLAITTSALRLCNRATRSARPIRLLGAPCLGPPASTLTVDRARGAGVDHADHIAAELERTQQQRPHRSRVPSRQQSRCGAGRRGEPATRQQQGRGGSLAPIRLAASTTAGSSRPSSSASPLGLAQSPRPVVPAGRGRRFGLGDSTSAAAPPRWGRRYEAGARPGRASRHRSRRPGRTARLGRSRLPQ
jgi:hypothetical protein